jgi:tRNA-specific 2-thiouridylase
MGHKVFVGLSGGVDSAVSAALLKERGFDVTGVFIKIWQPEFIECTWKEDRLDALRVCAALDIPFQELDLSEEYKKEVVEMMIADYARGVTPNPDVLCNRSIKFGAFASWAKAQGAEGIATGHYAQIREEGAHRLLLRARDAGKDQSYFLYRLGQPDLVRTAFPIGGLIKSEVRKAAERFGLPVAQKPDSQGLCFVGEVSMRDFLSRFIALEHGPVIDMRRRIIGEHDGAALYTLGQRHGFTARDSSEPHYIVGIDVENNTIRVSGKREDAARRSVLIRDMHWVYREPRFPYETTVQARYHEEPVPAVLSLHESGVFVTFTQPHIASAGQSLVIYEGEMCLGGGTISDAEPSKAHRARKERGIHTSSVVTSE